MARLTTANGVTVKVSADKAARLLAGGGYESAEPKKAPAKATAKADSK